MIEIRMSRTGGENQVVVRNLAVLQQDVAGTRVNGEDLRE
jgi:hypothetical protein